MPVVKETLHMLRQTMLVFLVLVLLVGTAWAQPSAKSKNSTKDAYPRPPMDVGVLLGGAIRGGLAFHTGIEARARLEPWFGAGLSYEFLYVDTYRTSSVGDGAADHEDYAHRAMLMGRFYPGKTFIEGFFLGIGAGLEALHTKKDGFDAIPKQVCSHHVCYMQGYTLKRVNLNRFVEPQVILRVSIGEEGAIGPVLYGGELSLDFPTGDEPDHKAAVSLRARVAYRF